MQGLCIELRSFASLSSSSCLFHSSSPRLHHYAAASSTKWSLGASLSNASSASAIQFPSMGFFASSSFSPLPTSFVLISSYKSRFRTMNDGTIPCWREGKNHNAHGKSKKSRRRLRQPSTVPAVYAKVMKKLNFCG